MVRQSMKWIFNSMMVLAVMACMTGCKDDDAPAPVTPEPEEPEVVEEPVKTAEELLSGIPNVTIIKDTLDVDGNTITYFYFEQPIDHTDALAGIFKQYCALHYKGPDHVTVLHTQGYSTAEPKDYKQLDLAPNLDANYIEVEHRYYKHSLINFVEKVTDCTGDYWKVNTAAQSTADLHAIVTALKGTGCFKNKWVSTGVSKNGILTSLYAYYYPNEVDVYVPFCAPFCTGLETKGIGEWLSQRSGMTDADGEVREQAWAAFRRIASDADLQKEITDLYNQEYNSNYDVKRLTRYILYRYMSGMFYKFCYRNVSEWGVLIPREDYNHSAEIYYRFAMLGKKDYFKNLKKLYQVMSKEIDWGTIFENDDDSDYMIDDDEDFQMDAYSRRVAPLYMKLDDFLEGIYYVHAAKELGYFLYDWSLLPEDYLTDENLEWFRNFQTCYRFIRKYGVTYDGGKLMNDFLDFVKNNRYKDKCKMIFIYGGYDPWTGAAIPDPDPNDPYVKKHIVPYGIHSGWINYEEQYSKEEKDWIMNAVREMLQ